MPRSHPNASSLAGAFRPAALPTTAAARSRNRRRCGAAVTRTRRPVPYPALRALPRRPVRQGRHAGRLPRHLAPRYGAPPPRSRPEPAAPALATALLDAWATTPAPTASPPTARSCGHQRRRRRPLAAMPEVTGRVDAREVADRQFADHDRYPRSRRRPAGLSPACAVPAWRSKLATMDDTANAHDTAARLGIAHLLDFVAGADAGHGAKPGPGMALAFSPPRARPGRGRGRGRHARRPRDGPRRRLRPRGRRPHRPHAAAGRRGLGRPRPRRRARAAGGASRRARLRPRLVAPVLGSRRERGPTATASTHTVTRPKPSPAIRAAYEALPAWIAACLPALRQAASIRPKASPHRRSPVLTGTEAEREAEVARADEEAVQPVDRGQLLAALEAGARLDHREDHRLLGHRERAAPAAGRRASARGSGAPWAVAAGRHQRLDLGDALDHRRDHARGPRIEQVPGQRGIDTRQAGQGRGPWAAMARMASSAMRWSNRPCFMSTSGLGEPLAATISAR